MNMKPKFKTLTKILASGSGEFSKPFELTRKVDGFVAHYKQGEMIELLKEVSADGEKEAKLKPHAAKKLKRTEDLFNSRKYAEERLKESKGLLEDTVKEHLKLKGAQKIKFEVEVSDDDTLSMSIKFTLGDIEETLEPSSLYVPSDDQQVFEQAQYGSSEVNWAAWLGVDGSPFYSQEWADAYNYDQQTIAMDQFVATLDESLFFSDLDALIDKMLQESQAE
jgi:hypothetical protein